MKGKEDYSNPTWAQLLKLYNDVSFILNSYSYRVFVGETRGSLWRKQREQHTILYPSTNKFNFLVLKIFCRTQSGSLGPSRPPASSTFESFFSNNKRGEFTESWSKKIDLNWQPNSAVYKLNFWFVKSVWPVTSAAFASINHKHPWIFYKKNPIIITP